MAGIRTMIYVARGATQWHMTPIGVAVYEIGGRLIGTRFDTFDSAFQRGDLPEWMRTKEYQPSVPQDWAEMTRCMEGMTNAMSCLFWDNGATSIDSVRDDGDREFVDLMFYTLVRPDLSPSSKATA